MFVHLNVTNSLLIWRWIQFHFSITGNTFNLKTIPPFRLPSQIWEKYARLALEEDLGHYDATTTSLELDSTQAEALMNAREDLVVCGVPLAVECFRYMDPNVEPIVLAEEGQRVQAGDPILKIKGRADALLSAERSALNYVQRLSGIATLTRKYVDQLKNASGSPIHTRLLDTRKTTPGLRLLEKYATQSGGAVNHRMGLDDMVMIKDNHLVAIKSQTDRPIQEAVRRVKSRFPGLKVELEIDSLDQLSDAIEAAPDRILLDNMSNEDLKRAVQQIPSTIQTEASGGVNLDTLAGIAATGVDFISVGALTHGARSVDIGLDFDSTGIQVS